MRLRLIKMDAEWRVLCVRAEAGCFASAIATALSAAALTTTPLAASPFASAVSAAALGAALSAAALTATIICLRDQHDPALATTVATDSRAQPD